MMIKHSLSKKNGETRKTADEKMVAKVFQGILFAATSIIIFQVDYEYSKTASKKSIPKTAIAL